MQTTTSQSTLDWGRFADLVEELDSSFPDKFPDHKLSDKEMAYRAGQISIIRLLKNHLSDE